MKKYFTRPLAALTALLLALSTLTACASTSNSDVQSPPESTVAADPANAEPEVTSSPEASNSEDTTTFPAETEPEETTVTEPITSATEPAVTTAPETSPAPATEITTTAATTQATTTAAPVTTAATTTIKVEPASGKMYAKSSVNVRSGPDASYERMGHLDEGEEVEITGLSENGWYRIKFKGGEHFVSGKYLVKEKPVVATTAATTVKTEKKEYDTEFIRDNGMEFVWKSMSNANAKENVAAVMNGMYECSKKISLPHPIPEDDLWLFVHYVHDYTCGYSHLKWYEYGYWYDGDHNVTDIELNYINSSAKAAEKMDAVNKKVDEIVENAPTDSEYERVKYLHDQLVNNCSYDYTYAKADSYNAYGALVKGEAVCHGYSNAMQLLLSRAGFDAVTVIGEVEGGGFHKWNYVKLSDGEWYGIDPTWDDTAGDEVVYTYFLVSDKTMKDGGHAKQYGSIYFTMPSSKKDYKAK